MDIKISVSTTSVPSDKEKFQMAQDFRSWTRKEIAKHCRRYFDMANKRIKRLESSQALSPALHAVMQSGGKFYAKGKDLKEMQHEYARCINFLNMSTSTVTGAKKYEKMLVAKFGGHDLSPKQRSKLFDAFHAIQKVSPGALMSYGSDRLIQYLADEITSEDDEIDEGEGSQDWDAMIENAINEVLNGYEAAMDDFNEKFRDIFTL